MKIVREKKGQFTYNDVVYDVIVVYKTGKKNISYPPSKDKSVAYPTKIRLDDKTKRFRVAIYLPYTYT